MREHLQKEAPHKATRMYMDGFYLGRCSQGARCNMNQLIDVLHCQVWH